MKNCSSCRNFSGYTAAFDQGRLNTRMRRTMAPLYSNQRKQRGINVCNHTVGRSFQHLLAYI